MTTRRPARALLLGGLAAVCVFTAPAAARGGDAAPGARSVHVVPLEGPAVDGPFGGLDAKGLRLEGREAPFPLDALREARFAAEAPPVALGDGAVGLRVALRGGEIIRGALVSGDGEALVVKTPGMADLKLPFDAILRVEAEPPGRDPCAEPTREHPPRKGTDLAYTRSGDAFPGTLLLADASGFTLEGEKDKTEKHLVRWADLVVLHLDEAVLPPPEGLRAEVETLGGTTLVATEVAGSASGLVLTTRSGLAVTVPLEALAVVRWTGGRFVYASDLPFTSVLTPYYGDGLYPAAWLQAWYGARADRTALGCPLRVHGTVFRHGIAVHPKSAVTVPLGKAFATFEAWLGIDDEAMGNAEGGHGNVTARVLADGREVWTSAGSVVGGAAPKRVGPLDVAGVTALVLEVDFGDEFFTKDRADWVDPVLVRAK